MAYERTLVRVRERSFLEVLDLATVVVRERPIALGIAAALGIAPASALNAWLTSDPDFPLSLFALLVLVEAPWVTAPLTLVLGDLMFGQRPRAGRSLSRLLRALPAMLVFQLLLRAVLIVTFFGIALLPTRLAFLNEVILLERDRWWRAPGRSARLCARRGGDLFGQWLATLAYGAAFVVCFWIGTGKILEALTTGDLTWERPGWSNVYDARFQVGLWLAIAFFAVARFLTYIDHRIRKEGWEVELRLGDAGRALEEAEAW
jgi:hypothetical protein